MSNTNSSVVNFTTSNKLFVFTFLLAIVTYGFALTNFTLSVDNETPIYSDYGLDFGRWGGNLLKFHLFNGHLVYFTMVIGLLVFSISAVRLVKVFKFNGISSCFFCALFITFPQLSYQLVFYMMADLGAIGVLISILSVELFIGYYENKIILKKFLIFFIVSLILMFSVSIYPVFLVVPLTILLLLSFQKSFEETFNLIFEIKKIVLFSVLSIFAAILYYFSIKLFCPPIQNSSYISSFFSSNTENIFSNFITLVKTHLKGDSYYGEKFFVLVPIMITALIVKSIKERKFLIIKILALALIIISPFAISFFNSAGYNPPRLYLTSNLIFAFLIVFTLNLFEINNKILTKISLVLVVLFNFYFVTNLFVTVNRIGKHDKKIAENIDFRIQSRYPDFYLTEKYVYFHGGLPYDYHQKFRLENSEIFGGSIYSWDNGSNFRLTNFFRLSEVADYKMVDSKEMYDTFKDSISKMPVWPNSKSIKLFKNVVVVKLGENKGAPLFFE